MDVFYAARTANMAALPWSNFAPPFSTIGIENDANRYANETMGNPAYPLKLFQRVITASLRTMEIVRGLPKLEVL